MKDPVCGMEVNASTAAATSQHQGQTIYFCSKECKEKFESNPSAYAVRA